MKPGFIEKVQERIQRMRPEDVQVYLGELAREKDFLETVFNSIQEAVIVVDSQGRIISINTAATTLLGIQEDQCIGKRLSEQVRGLDLDSIAEGDKAVNREMEIFYPESRFVNFYVVPLLDEKKKILGRAIILRDVTELRRSTEQTIESEKFSALTLLAAGVAHEIGNPLNSLNIHLHLAEKKLRKLPEKERGEIGESLRIAREEVSRLDQIITQFLRAVRPTPLETSMDSMNAIVEESVSFLEAEIRNRNVLVEMDLNPSLPLQPVDRNQLKQAFYNIIRNSAQAMKSGGVLRIRTGFDESHTFISFSDTGGGISIEHMGRLFEPYFTTKQGGSGLGLMIVQRIVREHGGEVMIESTQGVGMTLTIRLPRVDRRVRLLASGDDASS
ncbi:MAG: ATP-binding protein [Chthoniobacterales bacterium]